MKRPWLLMLLPLLGAPVWAAELTLLATETPPTSFLRDGQPDGGAVEIVRELIKRTGSRAHIELHPWTRVMYLTKHQADTGLFLLVRTPEREPLFQWVGPILRGTTRFYSLKSSHLKIDSLNEAEQAGTLALPKQWYSYEVLNQLGFGNLYGVPSPRHMVTMLKHGRVKLIAAEDLTLREELAAGGLSPEQVQGHVSIMQSDYYIGFSQQTSTEVVEQWRQALEQMRRDGSLQSIVHKWLPQAAVP